MPFESAADTKINVGRGQLDSSKKGSNSGVLGLTRADKLELSKAGITNILEGTMEKNRKAKLKKPLTVKEQIADQVDRQMAQMLLDNPTEPGVHESGFHTDDGEILYVIDPMFRGYRTSGIVNGFTEWGHGDIGENAAGGRITRRLYRRLPPTESLIEDDDIEILTKKITEAIGGKPLDISVADQKRQVEAIDANSRLLLRSLITQSQGGSLGDPEQLISEHAISSLPLEDIRLLIQRMLTDETGSKDSSKPSTESPSNSKPSKKGISDKNSSKASKKEPKVTPEDMTSLTDSINTLSEKVGG